MKRSGVFVLLILLLMSTALFAGGGQEAAETAAPAASTGGFDWRQFEGQTVVACWPNHGHYNATIKSGVIEEFEELTGIDVEIDLLQYIKMHDKQVLEMSKPSGGDYDMVSMVVMWKAEYAMGGMIEPLQPFFDNPQIAVPDYDYDDLVPGYVEVTGIAGGDNIYMNGPGAKLYGLPFGSETSFLVYRKDLFDQYGIEVPKTYDDLVEVSKFFHENVDGVGGLTMRGASGHHATHGFLLHASPFGARILEKGTWEPAFTKPEAIQTIEFMKKMVEYGPPGITGYTQDEEWQAFLQGDAAMYLDASVFTGAVNDPTKSKVVGKVGYALHPTAKTAGSETGGFGLAIPKNAANKEASFLFLQFLTMKETERKIIEAGGAPFRMSSVGDPKLQAQFPEFKILAEQLKYANPDWRPIIPEWGEINSTIGVYINQALTGEKSPEKAMQDAVDPIRDVLVRAGYLK
jgi:multiple sugar transport system substrate-binding protein